MKKIVYSLAVAATSTLLVACGTNGNILNTATSLLNGTNNTATNATTGATTQANTTTTQTSASATSSFGDIFGNVLSSVLGSGSVKQADLVGTWNYTGSSCVFESDNLLKKAGGAVAASQIESKMDEQLQKIGIQKGACSFTFNQDKTYKAVIGGKNVSGTYTLDETNKKITFKGALGIGSMTANVAKSGNKMNLLFESDKLLKLVSLVGSLSGNSAVTTLSQLAGSYDGMMIGLQLTK